MGDRRVLIVEADAALATAYRGALQSGGLTVDVLSDVDKAVEQAAVRSPDLLVLDADPTVGDAICRGVKKNGRQTPVVLVSANANTKRSLFGAHPDVVLQKPVSAEALLRSVASLLKIEMRAQSGEEIALDESLLEIVEEARPKQPAYPRPKTMVPPPAPPTPARKPTQLPRSAQRTEAPPDDPKRRELDALREALKKRPAKPAPVEDKKPMPGVTPAPLPPVDDRVLDLERERDKLRATIEELRLRAETEAANRSREIAELQAQLSERDKALGELSGWSSAGPELEDRLGKVEAERDKAWAELVELRPRAESAATLLAELEVLRAAIADREQQLAERDGRLAERDAMLADKERQLAELEAQRQAALAASETAQAQARAANELHAAEAARANELATSPVFARERELLEARRALNERDKQLLELRGEVEARERAILEHKHGTLEAERRIAALRDEMLAVEQALLAANEKNAEHEREIARLDHELRTEVAEREREAEAAQATLAQVASAHEQAIAALSRRHADEIAALHESAAAERAELEARTAARIEAMRNQAQEQLAAAEARRQADLGEAETRRQVDLAAADETRKRDLAEQAARAESEKRDLVSAHEQRLAELIREYEARAAEQEETFRDLKLGMKQRHASELEELLQKHAAQVAELEAHIAEIEGVAAQTMADLLSAREKIEDDRRRAKRAKKALAAALELLEQQKSRVD